MATIGDQRDVWKGIKFAEQAEPASLRDMQIINALIRAGSTGRRPNPRLRRTIRPANDLRHVARSGHYPPRPR
ncbi:hypothetical protein AB0C01_17645 [Micromonospora sp. NPDC048905]|uniref:hypothetical protein n=1 Tax=Micromonospora sp. NPDC048905 TaxID=3155494 RepID=UPI0033E54DD1